MDAEKLADKARSSLSSYCINECQAYCCRKGFLPVSAGQVHVVMQGSEDAALAENNLIKVNDDRFSLNLNAIGGCPSLQDNKCTIYTNRRRPLVCHEYPVFVRGRTVFISTRCYGVKEGKLYPFEKRFEMMGYKLSFGSQFTDLDLFKDVKKDDPEPVKA